MTFIMRGLDPRILFGGHKKDARLKAGHDERVDCVMWTS
jgi:hypothetical protein